MLLEDALPCGDPFGDPGQLNGHARLDLLGQADLAEIDVQDLPPDGVVLDLGDHHGVRGLFAVALDPQINEDVAACLRAQSPQERAAVDRQRHRRPAPAVEHRGHESRLPHLLDGVLPDLRPGRRHQAHPLHLTGPPRGRARAATHDRSL